MTNRDSTTHSSLLTVSTRPRKVRFIVNNPENGRSKPGERWLRNLLANRMSRSQLRRPELLCLLSFEAGDYCISGRVPCRHSEKVRTRANRSYLNRFAELQDVCCHRTPFPKTELAGGVR